MGYTFWESGSINGSIDTGFTGSLVYWTVQSNGPSESHKYLPVNPGTWIVILFQSSDFRCNFVKLLSY